jgi:hypothetical protein
VGSMTGLNSQKGQICLYPAGILKLSTDLHIVPKNSEWRFTPTPCKKQVLSKVLLLDHMLGPRFNSEDGGSMFLWKISEVLPDYTAL